MGLTKLVGVGMVLVFVVQVGVLLLSSSHLVESPHPSLKKQPPCNPTPLVLPTPPVPLEVPQECPECTCAEPREKIETDSAAGKQQANPLVALLEEEDTTEPFVIEDWVNDALAAKQLRKELHALQNPADCSTARALIHRFDTYPPRVDQPGLSSSLHTLSVHFVIAYKTKRTFLFDDTDDWIYVEKEACKQGNLLCYFASTSKCTVSNVIGSVGKAPPLTAKNYESERVVRIDGESYRAWDSIMPGKPSCNYYVPDAYAKNGVLWWRGMLLEFLLRTPVGVIEEHVISVKKELDFPTTPERLRNLAGLHIRMPDPRIHGLDSLPVKKYSNMASHFVNVYNAKELFIAADNEKSIAEFMEISTKSDRPFERIMVNKNARRQEINVDTPALLQQSHLNRTEEFLAAYTDLRLLSECRYIFGRMISNLCRLALELSAAVYGRTNPMLSVDGGWWPMP